MILGVGTDLIDIRRVESVYNRFGTRFLERCFTRAEQDKAMRRERAGTHINTLAKRFAAKEACSKALGTGFSHSVYHRDIGVENAPSGQPDLVLTNGALKRLNELLPDGMRVRIHLTLTDEPPLAKAMVLIEALEQNA